MRHVVPFWLTSFIFVLFVVRALPECFYMFFPPYYLLYYSSVRGGEVCCQTFHFSLFSLSSRLQVGLVTVSSSFFGVTTNTRTLNVRIF